MENNYTSYKNKKAYEDISNDEEDGATYEDGAIANANHAEGAIYTPTTTTNNNPENYEQETMDNNIVDKTPGI